jgi:hypothetical protein
MIGARKLFILRTTIHETGYFSDAGQTIHGDFPGLSRNCETGRLVTKPDVVVVTIN